MAELRTSPAKAKFAACRAWVKRIERAGGPVYFCEQRILGTSTSFLALELGFDETHPARLDYCDGCGHWSPIAAVGSRCACSGRPRGWYKTLRRALLALLEREARRAA